MLLHEPRGVGKTHISEWSVALLMCSVSSHIYTTNVTVARRVPNKDISLAEYSRKPLYVASCTDFGERPHEVQRYLEVTLMLTQR